jgi:hypothetical protein
LGELTAEGWASGAAEEDPEAPATPEEWASDASEKNSETPAEPESPWVDQRAW